MHRMVPDLILQEYARGQFSGGFPAMGIFVDISGFSAMTDALMQHGQHGAEILAQVMRTAFTPFIQAVYEQGGFIVNQAGDSFTALFRLEVDAEAVKLRALTAAWNIRERAAAHSVYETPYGLFIISAKTGLALGEASWGILTADDGHAAAYYFRGSAVDGCAEAEHQARPGDAILARSMADAVQHLALVEPAGEPSAEYVRLTAMKGTPAEPLLFELPELKLELAGHFFPEPLIIQAHSGEFRQVLNLFISLPTVRTEVQLKIFIQTLFTLRERYGGLLNRLSFGDKGSHLLLFWGAPLAYENDVERALDFILELQAQTEIPINAGLTYRMAHAGFIGSELCEEYTCFGRGVNLAARFMTAAPRGEVWLDEPVAQRAQAKYNLEALGDKTFKGFSQPQKVFLLLDRKEWVEQAYQGELVGRATELEQLRAFVQPLFAGQYAGMLVIWGEPGLGKSRLAHEFLERLGETHAGAFQVHLGQSQEILRQSLNPFRYWLKHYFEQSAEHSDAHNKRNFNRRLNDLIAAAPDARLGKELDRTHSCLGALVGLEWADSLYEQLDAQGRFENILTGLVTLILAESRQRPLIFLLEDAHWLDEDSKIFLPRLLRQLAEEITAPYPVALLVTARYEGAGLPLGDMTYHEIQLSGLDRAGLAGLAETVLGGPASAALVGLLLERAEGNPFFAEQILHYLREEGRLICIEQEWAMSTGQGAAGLLPDTIQAVLVARLDRLTAEVREVVQTAAVLGREFEVRLLSEMLSGDSELEDKVKQAEQAAIWAALTEIRYIFRHALLREAAYNMQVQSRRQALHALSLAAIERLYAVDSAKVESSAGWIARFGELAYHAERAGLAGKALDYLTRAGDAASSAFQNSDAVDYYSRALALAGADLSGEQVRHLHLQLGQALEKTGQYEKAMAVYESLTVQAHARGDRGLELAAMMAKAAILGLETPVQDREGGVELGQQALRLARAIGDRPAEAAILANLSLAYSFLTQNPQDSLPYAQQSLALARELNLPEHVGYALIRLSSIYIFNLGEFATGQAMVKEMIDLWREMGNLHKLSEAYEVSIMAYFLSGEYGLALERIAAAGQIDHEIGYTWGSAYCAVLQAVMEWERGEYLRGLHTMTLAVHYGDQSGYLMAQVMGRSLVGMFYGHLGRPDEGAKWAGQAVALGRNMHQAFLATSLAVLAWMHVLQGDLAQANTAIQEAGQILRQRISFPIEPNFVSVVGGLIILASEDWPALSVAADQASAMITAMHNRLFSMDAAYQKARALAALGQGAQARSLLEQARADAERSECRRILWPIYFALGQLELDPAKAGDWFEKARAVIKTIADGINDAELKAAFLSQAPVSEVLNTADVR